MTNPPSQATETLPIRVCVGVAPWKRQAVSRLLAAEGQSMQFISAPAAAVAAAKARSGAIAIWPSRTPRTLEDLARVAEVPVVRIEDGFIRSAGLGAECHPPASIVVDRRGMYFDPSRPSDLEHILAFSEFDAAMIARAETLIAKIVALGVTKYNLDADAASILPPFPTGRRVALVVGQVEDDLSVQLGGAGVRGNLDLLRRARAMEPDALIVFRPHPDVDGGHRKGALRDDDVLRYADRIARGGSLNAVLSAVSVVHVLSSLTGFEALLRGCEVVVHGQPFYAGWGLTHDLAPPPRRGRRLSLAQLAAGALILYPLYIHPATGDRCTPEDLVQALSERRTVAPGLLPLARRVQGRIRRVAGDTRAAVCA